MTNNNSKIYLNLKTYQDSQLFLERDSYQFLLEEIESFLTNHQEFQTVTFAKKVLLSHEIESFNLNDFTKHILNSDKRRRKINLYKAYEYILTHKNITPDSLKELYSIISANSLRPYEYSNMGKYYRNGPVWILKSGKKDADLDEAAPVSKIAEMMNSYFNFLYTDFENTKLDEFVKSQILQFYMVYIHPYFDANGRTSRTLATWYLLNKNIYPYVLFNRGVKFDFSNTCDKVITKTKETFDLTDFIKLMLELVKIELEKEYIIEVINSTSTTTLSENECEALLTFLSMNGPKTVGNLCTVIDNSTIFNPEYAKLVYELYIEPLIKKGALIEVSEVLGTVYRFGPRDKELSLNMRNIDKNKIKNLHI